MSDPSPETLLFQASVVVIEGRALGIIGPPGSGKSSLALALIDRGAQLIGDDGAAMINRGGTIIAAPPPNIAGLIEIRGVGIITLPAAAPAPLALMLDLGTDAQRLPGDVPRRDILGVGVPCLPFHPGAIAPALRAEFALELHGLKF